jgi:hypothetical protein
VHAEKRTLLIGRRELLGPGLAAIGGGEDDRIVPHRPAALLVDEAHRSEERRGRRLRRFQVAPLSSLVTM